MALKITNLIWIRSKSKLLTRDILSQEMGRDKMHLQLELQERKLRTLTIIFRSDKFKI